MTLEIPDEDPFGGSFAFVEMRAGNERGYSAFKRPR